MFDLQTMVSSLAIACSYSKIMIPDKYLWPRRHRNEWHVCVAAVALTSNQLSFSIFTIFISSTAIDSPAHVGGLLSSSDIWSVNDTVNDFPYSFSLLFQSRPIPSHLTSAVAESILASACESESRNAAKRMRLDKPQVLRSVEECRLGLEKCYALLIHSYQTKKSMVERGQQQN